MRFLAIDPGNRRVGFATGDDDTRIVTPLCVTKITGDEQLLEHAAAIIGEQEPDAIVMGLAVNMDGTEGPGAKRSRVLANALADRVNLKVHLIDERLSSFAADQRLMEQNLSRMGRRKRHDAYAAAVILELFFQSG